MTVTSRGATLRDFVIFQVKLALDGFKDMVVFGLSIGAIVLDFISGQGDRPRLFYSVVRLSERFDHWLDLHAAARTLEDRRGEAGSDPLIAEIEQLARGARRTKRPEEDPRR
jgi:hypothetical protein